MSKKEDKKKKTLSPLQVKLLEDLATLSKNYKSSCKRLGTSTYSSLLQDLAASTEAIQPLTKVACQGCAVDSDSVTSIVEVLQSYAACRGLAFMGCNFGDQALQAVTGLLQNGCGKWWTGPKLQLLEITSQPQSTTGGLTVPIKSSVGQRQQQSSSLAVVSSAAVAVTSETVPLVGPLQPTNAAISSQPLGIVPSIQAAALLNPEALLLDTASQAGMGSKTYAPVKTAASVRTTPIRKLQKTAPAMPQQTLIQQRLEQSRSSMDAVKPQHVLPGEMPVTFAASTLSHPGPLFIKSFPDTSLDSSTTLPQASSSGRNTKLPVTGAMSEAGLWKSTVWGQGTAQGFGMEALIGLATALGTQGIQLTVLTLSYIDLGDTGMQHLCKGIGRCSPLQKLTLSFCNIGVHGAAFLAEAITPIQPPAGKAVWQPKLTYLDLQGNALGGEGLSSLCPGIAACITLAEVNLKAVGVTDQHQEAVRQFANVASCHPSLQIINLDCNLIGDAGAALMLTAIQAKPEIWQLCVTRFISRTLMTQLTQHLGVNAKLQKAKGKKGSKKKASTSISR